MSVWKIRRLLLFIYLSFIPSLLFSASPLPQEIIDTAKNYYFNAQYDKAIELFLPIANKDNNPEAQYYTGLIYSLSAWEKYDLDEAMKYLLSSADQNYAPAMWKIGDIHENGLKRQNNLVIATDWYRKAKQTESKEGNILFYQQDSNNTQNRVKNERVIGSLTSKANNGNVEAQLKLATIYDDGVLIRHDAHKAYEWYLKAANNQNKHAQFMVGYFICRKIGTDFNQAEAQKWLKMSERNAQCTEQ